MLYRSFSNENSCGLDKNETERLREVSVCLECTNLGSTIYEFIDAPKKLNPVLSFIPGMARKLTPKNMILSGDFFYSISAVNSIRLDDDDVVYILCLLNEIQALILYIHQQSKMTKKLGYELLSLYMSKWTLIHGLGEIAVPSQSVDASTFVRNSMVFHLDLIASKQARRGSLLQKTEEVFGDELMRIKTAFLEGDML